MKLWPSKKEKEYPKEGEVYEFVDFDSDEKITAIKILKGKFEGVIYHYGIVEVVDENPPKIKFEYFLDDLGNFSSDHLQSNEEFDILMGDIIVSIFDNNIIKKEKEIDDEVGTNDSKEFNLQ